MFRRSGHVLAALLLLAVMGVQLVEVASCELRRMAVRHEMKQRIRQELPMKELVRFTFTPAEYEALEKEDGGREFWVDGHIYDVVRSMIEADGKVHIEAVDDREEARLMAGLNDLVERGMEQLGRGRNLARTVVTAFPCSLPIEPLSMVAPSEVAAPRFPDHGAPALEGAVGDHFQPPRD